MLSLNPRAFCTHQANAEISLLVSPRLSSKIKQEPNYNHDNKNKTQEKPFSTDVRPITFARGGGWRIAPRSGPVAVSQLNLHHDAFIVAVG